ncbi:hypothetical protein ACWFR0_42735, partial [Streptomyces noursei]
MSQLITTPVLEAMSREGLTEPVLVLDDARVAAAYTVLHIESGRFGVVTLAGEWVAPGKGGGYKSRGPATSYVRKNLATLRPEGLRVMEPIVHEGRPQVGRYGARRKGLRCGGLVSMRGVGYECSKCGASVNDVYREGFSSVLDGRRGSHVMAYALDHSHWTEFGSVPMDANAPRVILPESAAAEASEDAPEQDPAERATTAAGVVLDAGKEAEE